MENSTYVEHDQENTDPHETMRTILNTFVFSISPLICIGNLLTIIVIIKYNQMRTFTNAFVLTLAIADFSVGLTFMVFRAAVMIDQSLKTETLFCLFVVFTHQYLLCIQLLSLTAVATERYIAIIHPYKHVYLIVKQRVTTVLDCIWGIPLPIMASFVFFVNKPPELYTRKDCSFYNITIEGYKIFILTIFAILWVMLTFIYSVIFCTAKKHIRDISKYTIKPPVGGCRQALRRLTANIHLAKMLAYVFGFFYISYVPYFTVVLISVQYDPETEPYSLETVRLISSKFIYMTSLINPVTYAWKDKHFRCAFRSLMRCDSSVRVEDASWTSTPQGTPTASRSASQLTQFGSKVFNAHAL